MPPPPPRYLLAYLPRAVGPSRSWAREAGRHPGRLLAYSQGDGASFVPSRPFADGERVSVRASLHQGARTTPFAWRLHRWPFATAAAKRAELPTPLRTRSTTRNSPPPGPSAAHRDGHRSPARNGCRRSVRGPYSGPGQYGPMILDENGGLVWFKPLSPQGTRAADFRVQQYEGRPVLTWWQDPLPRRR